MNTTAKAPKAGKPADEPKQSAKPVADAVHVDASNLSAAATLVLGDQRVSVTGKAEEMRAKLEEAATSSDDACVRYRGPQLKVKRVDESAKLPAYKSAGAAAFDLHALHAGHIAPGASMTFRTGLMIEVPEGACLKIYSRSGMGFKHGVRLANSVGVIDCDYRGEILIRLTNDNARDVFVVEPGDSIAQAMVEAAPQFEIVEADILTTTERGTAGFGSTDERTEHLPAGTTLSTDSGVELNLPTGGVLTSEQPAEGTSATVQLPMDNGAAVAAFTNDDSGTVG